MSSHWTEKQLHAINARNCSIIVSAAAGSGKTSVLIEHLMQILSDTENKIPADRIIVVTFTNDAATQMKQRLSSALSLKLAENPGNSWLAYQQTLIPSAKISTIHSFCFDMIRENIQLLDVSAGFRILDEAEDNLITAKALENVFENFYTLQPKFMEELCELTCSTGSDYNLEQIVLSVFKFLQSTPFPEKWLKDAENFYANGFDPNCELADIYTDVLISKILSAKKYIHSAISFITQTDDVKNIGVMQNDLTMLSDTAKLISDKTLSWDERISAINVKWARLAPKSKNSEENELRKMAVNMRNKAKDELNILSKKELVFTSDQIKKDYEDNKKIIAMLSRIVLALIAETASLKSEKNALGFSDAEHFAIKLLCTEKDGKIEQSPIAKELSEYYKVVMIDEFQDVNDTQNLIFRMLSHNGTADTNGDDLFSVGDVKQSIYGFRMANPSIFINTLKNADEYTPDYSGKNAAILLNKNFRSSKDVVEFVNFVFGHLMTERIGGINYTSAEQLEYGASYPEKDNATEFIFAREILETSGTDEISSDNDSEPTDDDITDNKEESLTEVNAEAMAAAQKISSMLGNVTVNDHGTERPCECRDFCILLRDNARGTIYSEALSKFGIRSFCEQTKGYLDSPEISVLTNILRIIDNPMNDIPLASVLMSPMFMLSDEEAAELRTLSENKYDHLYNCILLALQDGDPYNFSAIDKLKNFSAVFSKLRICAASQDLVRLIRTIYDSTGFLASVQVYSDGEQKKANLRLLLEYAKSYEKNSSGGLSGFIRFLDSTSEKGGDFTRASVISPSDNVVSIKTIHKSKGLEYPFVFLCGTSKPFNTDDAKATMQKNIKYGMGFKIFNRKLHCSYKSFPQFILSSINRRETISEEMRLLYVALTRAKEKLFITIPDNQKTEKLALKTANAITSDGIDPSFASSMLNWLFAILLIHPDGQKLNPSERDIDYIKGGCRIKISYSEEVSDQKTVSPEKIVPDENKVLSLLNEFTFKYDDTLSQKAAKLTITEIAKSEQETIFLSRPDFSSETGRLTAAEKGTAMHTFMQYADYSAAESSPAAEASSLFKKGLLSKAEKDSLDLANLEKFFKSNLYSRIKASSNVRREQKFLVEISQLALDDELGKEYNNTNGMLQGIADCLFEEDGGLILLDYKTDRVKTEKELTDRYFRQLYLYSIALEKIFGLKVKEAYIYSFALDKEIKVV